MEPSPDQQGSSASTFKATRRINQRVISGKHWSVLGAPGSTFPGRLMSHRKNERLSFQRSPWPEASSRAQELCPLPVQSPLASVVPGPLRLGYC